MKRIEVRQFIERRPKQEKAYGGSGYMMLNQAALGELLERLNDHTLGMQAVRVLMAMLESADYENRVEASQKEICARLGMATSSVAKASKELVDCGFVERLSNRRGWYRISPNLAWKGQVRNLAAALRERKAA